MYHKQKGATVWQWLFVGGMAAIFVYIGLMLAPIYYENMGVKRALNSLKDVGGARMSKSEITRKITQQFKIDQVTRANKEHINFKPLKEGMQVSIDYDVQIPLISNISLLVEFRDKVVL